MTLPLLVTRFRLPTGMLPAELRLGAGFLWRASRCRRPFVFIIAMLMAMRDMRTPTVRSLCALSIPLLLLMTAQALISRAFANWAVGAYAAGLLLATPWLAARPHWLRASLILNTVVAIILPC